jgi:hypothetical protein
MPASTHGARRRQRGKRSAFAAFGLLPFRAGQPGCRRTIPRPVCRCAAYPPGHGLFAPERDTILCRLASPTTRGGEESHFRPKLAVDRSRAKQASWLKSKPRQGEVNTGDHRRHRKRPPQPRPEPFHPALRPHGGNRAPPPTGTVQRSSDGRVQLEVHDLFFWPAATGMPRSRRPIAYCPGRFRLNPSFLSCSRSHWNFW